MTTESDTVVDSVEIICEPGVSRKWLLQMSQVASTKLTAESTSSRAVVPTILAVEHEIAATIEEQGDAVARVVHSFCGRDVHDALIAVSTPMRSMSTTCSIVTYGQS